MAAALQVYGTEKLSRLGKDLRVIGGPTSRGIRSNMRKGIVASVAPMKKAVQDAAKAIPGGAQSTGLRADLAQATRMKVLASSRNAVVRLQVDPKAMSKHPGSLVAHMEGVARSAWKHPVYADPSKTRDAWAWSKQPQASHPFFFPTVKRRIGAVRAAVVAEIVKTTNQLPKEM